jgi:hypothetical protein
MAIGVVESRDEVPAGSLRRIARTPRRRAAPRVHDIDVVLHDQLRQAIDIAADHERVLGSKGQCHMSRADTVELARHRSAFRRDDRVPAVGDQRRRDIDRAALDPAHHQPWQNLQHCAFAASGAARRGVSVGLRHAKLRIQQT